MSTSLYFPSELWRYGQPGVSLVAVTSSKRVFGLTRSGLDSFPPIRPPPSAEQGLVIILCWLWQVYLSVGAHENTFPVFMGINQTSK